MVLSLWFPCLKRETCTISFSLLSPSDAITCLVLLTTCMVTPWCLHHYTGSLCSWAQLCFSVSGWEWPPESPRPLKLSTVKIASVIFPWFVSFTFIFYFIVGAKSQGSLKLESWDMFSTTPHPPLLYPLPHQRLLILAPKYFSHWPLFAIPVTWPYFTRTSSLPACFDSPRPSPLWLCSCFPLLLECDPFILFHFSQWTWRCWDSNQASLFKTGNIRYLFPKPALSLVFSVFLNSTLVCPSIPVRSFWIIFCHPPPPVPTHCPVIPVNKCWLTTEFFPILFLVSTIAFQIEAHPIFVQAGTLLVNLSSSFFPIFMQSSLPLDSFFLKYLFVQNFPCIHFWQGNISSP